MFSEKASTIASEMRQNGSCLLGKEERSKMRQKGVKNARNTFGGEHLLDDTEKWSGENASTWAAKVPMYINGERVQSKTDKWYDVHNPATGELIARTPLCTPDEMEAAAAGCAEVWARLRKKTVS